MDTTVGRVGDVPVIVVVATAVGAAAEVLVVDRVVGTADWVPLVHALVAMAAAKTRPSSPSIWP